MMVKDLIRQRRLAKGLSMAALGKLVGVSRSTVSRWESGDLDTMKHTKINRLADALGLSTIDLLQPFGAEQAGPIEEEATLVQKFQAVGSACFKVILTEDEVTLIQKFRQLSSEAKRNVMVFLDFSILQGNATPKSVKPGPGSGEPPSAAKQSAAT